MFYLLSLYLFFLCVCFCVCVCLSISCCLVSSRPVPSLTPTVMLLPLLLPRPPTMLLPLLLPHVIPLLSHRLLFHLLLHLFFVIPHVTPPKHVLLHRVIPPHPMMLLPMLSHCYPTPPGQCYYPCYHPVIPPRPLNVITLDVALLLHPPPHNTHQPSILTHKDDCQHRYQSAWGCQVDFALCGKGQAIPIAVHCDISVNI